MREDNLRGEAVATSDHRTRSGALSVSSLSREETWRLDLGTVPDSSRTLLTLARSRRGSARSCQLGFRIPLEIEREEEGKNKRGGSFPIGE